MRAVNIVALVLLVIGGLNWGLVGLFEYDLVAALFGDMSVLSRIVYVLVGLAALYELLHMLTARREVEPITEV
ncbi:DUF378 domain-containing protein [Candidatus Saccharibacteria bacterium 32-49-12]|nr:MAG: DUF378 domain-containing protein [Candidatus Saccharibacteria bacterium 32-49-12]